MLRHPNVESLRPHHPRKGWRQKSLAEMLKLGRLNAKLRRLLRFKKMDLHTKVAKSQRYGTSIGSLGLGWSLDSSPGGGKPSPVGWLGLLRPSPQLSAAACLDLTSCSVKLLLFAF